jgi:AcrR family transcriptional regulator
MPKISPKRQLERRDMILDHAESCFAKNGFHRTTIQDICKAASLSPGAVYLYFASKEQMIAGLCERERGNVITHLRQRLQAGEALNGIKAILKFYALEAPREKRIMFLEIGTEAQRNPQVAAMFQQADRVLKSEIRDMLIDAAKRGDITLVHDAQKTIRALFMICDGLFWRLATDPSDPPERLMTCAFMLLDTLFINSTPSFSNTAEI